MICKSCGYENGEDARFCANCGESMASAERLGPYELRGELGRGAMARVWRAWDPNLEREVAIKEPIFDAHLAEDVLEDMGRRFVKEGRTAAGLHHPGIVTIYAADVYDGRPVIVMELVEGATLGDILERGALDPATALDALDQLLDAIGYAHAQGVVHRDIKPDNVFVSADGHVKLADFGIAHVDDAIATRATVAGAVLGTPGYMSPEQATGKTVDARSDLFSIGVVGYEMLVGSNPFGAGSGTDATTLLYRIVHEPASELPERASAGLPSDMRPAIMAALAKDPADRPQTADAFKAMLHGEPSAPTARVPLKDAGPATPSGLASAASKASGGTLPKWLPYAVVAVVGVIVLAVVFFGATLGSGGSVVGGASPARTSSPAPAASSPVYLAVKDGKVAIYTNSSASPYEVSDVEVADLSDSDQDALDDHIGFSTVEEAQVKVDQLRESAEKAKKEAEEKAAQEAADKAAREAEEAARAQAQAQAQAQARGDYILPNSSSVYLTRGDVSGLSNDDLSRAMNEIWARHGRRFNNNWLQSYFNSKSWYAGTIAPEDFLSRYSPSDVENKNAELMNAILTERGYDVNKAHPN